MSWEGAEDRTDGANQPPEVDEYSDHDDRFPPADKAAERVLAFVRFFGDGEIIGNAYGTENPPLFARDLEAIAKAALAGAAALAIHDADGRRWVGFPRANREEAYCTECNEPAPCPTVVAARKATE